MKISRIAVLLLSLVVIVSSAFALVSCGEEKVSFEIKFSADEGKNVHASYKVVEGDAVALPEDPVKDGYDFAGWYFDIACERPMPDDYTASEDVMFYAKWETHVHELTHVDANEPTCLKDGNVEYWYCALCDKYYDDDGLAAEQILDVKLTDGTHKYDESNVCEYCKKEKNEIILKLNSDKSGYIYLGEDNIEAVSVSIPSVYKELPIVEIAASAFEGYANMTEIVIPDSVKVIGADAFKGCVALKSVTIPQAVVSIENGAFYNCIALETVNFDASNCAHLKSANLVFAYDAEDSEVEPAALTLNVGAAVKVVPAFLFENCANLTAVDFAEAAVCEQIGDSAFAGTGIAKIDIPASVKSVGNGFIMGTANLSSITVAEGSNVYIASGN